jgi:hypothetical protein
MPVNAFQDSRPPNSVSIYTVENAAFKFAPFGHNGMTIAHMQASGFSK